METGADLSNASEKGYRHHYLQADIKLSSLITLVWLITVVIFIPVDYFSLGFTKEFYTFLTTRLIFTVSTLAVIFGLRKATQPRQYDIFISLVLLLAVAFAIFGCIILKQDYVGQLIFDILIIITVYAIFPGPLSTKIIASLLLSAKAIYLLFNQEQILANSGASIIASIIMTNVLGYYSWRAITRVRHQQYNIHMELQQARENAEHLARIDSLTGVNNRRAFMEHGLEEFSRSRRYQRSLSLALIDIDDFKSINDCYGHQAGDMVLQKFTQTASTQIREQDILGRLGGDEFGIIFPETALEEAQMISTRLCETFRKMPIAHQDQQISTSFSAGIVTTQTSDQAFEQVLQRADQKLYQAKQTGKNHIEF